MRKSLELDNLLENAVAAALGLRQPHPRVPARIRAVQRRPAPRRHRAGMVPRHDHKVAA